MSFIHELAICENKEFLNYILDLFKAGEKESILNCLIVT
jgi:hypothetical protein